MNSISNGLTTSSTAGSSSALAVSVVVPVYGGTAALAELCARVGTAMREAGLGYEVILVDDHGPDDAWQVISDIALRDNHVRGVRLSRNFGQHAATICGITHAAGEWIVTMDDDLEHPPEAISSLLAAGRPAQPLVYGVFPVRTHNRFRNLSSELMRWSLTRAFPDMNSDYTSFRAIHRPIALELARFGLNRPYIDGMLSWITSSVATVEVPHGERRHGESAYTFKKLIAHALNIFVTFSHVPLRIATYGGMALAAMSFLYIVYLLWGRLTGFIDQPGYTSVMSVILFACGVQLTILGLIGEYIGRLMGATYRKPVFVVSDLTARRERG
jgi:undecaprenyl-phosphate 4-deoxy-4-formamido-L-arabinose transferase